VKISLIAGIIVAIVVVSVVVIYINYNNSQGISQTNPQAANGPSHTRTLTLAYGVASQPAIGNAYVVGFTNSTLVNNHAKRPGQDAFISNYNKDGNQVWVKQFGTGTFENVRAYGVANDSSGNAYVVGTVEGAFPGQTNLGTQDAFIAKYDKDGNQVWVKQFETKGNTSLRSIATDSATGNVLSAGFTLNSTKSSNQTSTGEQRQDAFIAKYDKDGNQVWVKQFGTTRSVIARSVALDSTTGNAYVVGDTNGVFQNQTAKNQGGEDAFIAKYDKDGNQVWVKQF
jgi:hypothetical protein